MSLPACDPEGPNHHASPRSMLLRMPREILGSILLVLRDDAVAQAGYTQEGSSGIPAGSPPGLSWLAATRVCGGLRDVALAMPDLWTVIVLEDGVAWANVFAKRSGTMPLSIHADCRRIRARTVSLRVSRQRQREEVVILAAIPRFGSRVSRLTVQGYAVSSLQGLVDALNWSYLNLETLSLGNFSRVEAFRLPRTFLDKQAPHLTSLDLRHVTFDFQQPWVAFNNLRRLRLQFLSQRVSTEQHTGSFCNWLKEMPLLEEISLFPQSLSTNISDSQWHRPVGATHPLLRRFSMTEFGCLLWTRTLATEISFPSDALAVSFNISGTHVNMPLEESSFQHLVEYLRRFWGPQSAPGARAGLDDSHLPTIRLRPNTRFSDITLELDRPGRPSHLQLNVIGPPEHLLSALRAVCRQLLPLYTIEELRVYGQEMLPPDLLSDDFHLLDACRALIVHGTGSIVPMLGLLPGLRELRIQNTEEDDRPDPAPLLQWLRHRDDLGAPRLQLLTFGGNLNYGLQGVDPAAATDAMRLLVGDLQWC